MQQCLCGPFVSVEVLMNRTAGHRHRGTQRGGVAVNWTVPAAPTGTTFAMRTTGIPCPYCLSYLARIWHERKQRGELPGDLRPWLLGAGALGSGALGRS
jgi:hypothetical protein